MAAERGGAPAWPAVRLLLAAALLLGRPLPAMGCPGGANGTWAPFGERCYRLVLQPALGWGQAQAYCAGALNGTGLAEAGSLWAGQALAQWAYRAAAPQPVWLGLQYDAGGGGAWRWAQSGQAALGTGEWEAAYGPAGLGGGGPAVNGQCGAVNGTSRGWQPRPCGATLPFLCEYRPPGGCGAADLVPEGASLAGLSDWPPHWDFWMSTGDYATNYPTFGATALAMTINYTYSFPYLVNAGRFRLPRGAYTLTLTTTAPLAAAQQVEVVLAQIDSPWKSFGTRQLWFPTANASTTFTMYVHNYEFDEPVAHVTVGLQARGVFRLQRVSVLPCGSECPLLGQELLAGGFPNLPAWTNYGLASSAVADGVLSLHINASEANWWDAGMYQQLPLPVLHGDRLRARFLAWCVSSPTGDPCRLVVKVGHANGDKAEFMVNSIYCGPQPQLYTLDYVHTRADEASDLAWGFYFGGASPSDWRLADVSLRKCADTGSPTPTPTTTPTLTATRDTFLDPPQADMQHPLTRAQRRLLAYRAFRLE